MVGGFVVTDRMLEMFKPKKTDANQKPESNGKNGGAE
jgi:NAD/NADP transhydrogenase alpha subunit